MKTNKFKRAIVMLLAITMLLTSTGMASFAESMGEGADKVSTEAVVTESGSDAVQAAAEEAAAEINDEEVPEAAPAESAEPAEEPAEEAVEEAKTELTAKDWEAGLPDKISKDVREAMAQVAKSQLKAEGDLYKAFANAESLDNWDASFVMFVLEYANVLGVSKAIGDESKGTVDKDDISVPVNADTDKWIKALKDKDLFTEISEEAAPGQGDIVFTEDGAAVVIDAEDLTVIGAHNNNVEKFKADADKVSGFVSLKDIAPAEFKDEEQAEEPAEEAVEEADDADKEDAEELTAEELAAKKAEEEAKKAAEEAAMVKDETTKESIVKEEGLREQTVKAELVAAPGIGGKLKSLFGSNENAEITLSGLMPKDAIVKAYPVSVDVPGQNVVTAYDITIYVKDEEGNEVEWQPVEALSVSIKDEKIAEASEGSKNNADFNVYHMEDKKSSAKPVAEVKSGSDKVAFDAESFSIYIVSQDAEVVTYEFWNGDSVYCKQVLKNNETLVEPASPVKDGAVFQHWSATQNGETPYTFGSVTVDDTNKGTTVKLYAVYGEDKIYITYYDQDDAVVQRDAIARPSAGSTATEDTTAILYTPKQDKGDVFIEFRYWTEGQANLALPNPPQAGDNGIITIDADTNNIDLYPVVAEGHWIYFDSNKSTIGGESVSVSYVAPKFVVNGDSTAIANLTAEKATTAGYTFNGWWTRKNGGKQIFDENGDQTNNINDILDHQGSLANNPTLYAHWTPEENVSYTVIFWKQNIEDDKNAGDSAKKYDYVESVTRTAAPGSTVSIQTADTEKAGSEGYEHFHYNSVNSDESAKVRGDGSTVLNVRYDRDLMTFHFKRQDTVYSVSTATNTGNHYIPDGNGGYTQVYLYRHEGKWYRNRTVSGSWLNPYEYSNEYVGDIYERGTGWVPDESLTMTGLYGQPITKYGYTWPANELWVYENDTSHLTPLRSEFNANLELLYNSAAGSSVIAYYKQNLDGSYPTSADLQMKYNSTTNVGISILRNVFTGYHIESYRVKNGNNWGSWVTNIDYNASVTLNQGMEARFARDTEQFVYADSRTGAAIGSNVHANVLYGESLSNYDIDYTDIKTTYGVDGFGPDDGYQFAGWFSDVECKSPFNFEDSTMPANNIIVYAGWEKIRFKVDIDPNGGEVGMPNNDHATYFNVEYGDTIASYNDVTRDYVEVSDGTGRFEYRYFERNGDPSEDPDYAGDDYSANWKRTARYKEVSSGGTYANKPGVYTLVGWFRELPNGQLDSKPYNFGEQVTSDVRLQAKWRRSEAYTIKYTTAAGTQSPTDKTDYIEGANAIVADPGTAPAGQRFTHWTDKKGKVYKPNDFITVAEDLAEENADGGLTIELTAHYVNSNMPEGYMADYVFINGSETVYTQTIACGEELVQPEDPSEPDKIFIGWFYDREGKHRFDGFGVVNQPVNTTLYAKFEKAYTVTYYMPNADGTGAGDAIITTQVYEENKKLNTLYVDCPTDDDHLVEYWVKVGTAGKYCDYKTVTNIPVTENLVLYPKLAEQKLLRFDTQTDKCKVEPVKIPLQGWPALPLEPTREGYVFDGWWTAPVGGVEYEFNKTLSDFKAEHSLENDVELLYAHWEFDNANPKQGAYSIIWWAQTPDRDEDGASDFDHYEMIASQTMTGNYGRYTAEQILAQLDGLNATDMKAVVDNAVNSNDANAKSFKERMEGSTDDLGNYYEYAGAKSDDNLTIDDSGNCTLNLRFDLKTFTLVFDTRENGEGDYLANFVIGGNEYPIGTNYSFAVWLNRDLTDVWPFNNTSRIGEGQAFLNWTSNKKFGGWTYNDGDTKTYSTLQKTAARPMVDLARNNGGTYTFTPRTTTLSTIASIHYYLENLNGELEEDKSLEQDTYYISTSSQNLIGNANQYQYYKPMNAKELDGFDVISTESADYKYNIKVEGKCKARYVKRDTEPIQVPVTRKVYSYSINDDYKDVTFYHGVDRYFGLIYVRTDYYPLTFNAGDGGRNSYSFTYDGGTKNSGTVYYQEQGQWKSFSWTDFVKAVVKESVEEVPTGDYETVTPTAHELHFYYSRNSYNLNLKLDENTTFESAEVLYETQLSGSNGYLKNFIPISPDPDKEFSCWSISPNVESCYIGTMPSHTLTLYASWTSKRVKVTTYGYKQDGTETTDENEFGVYWADINTDLKNFGIETPHKAGENFEGWYRMNGATQTDQFVSVNETIKSDIVIYPKFEGLGYRGLLYDANGGSGDVPADTHKYVRGSEITILSGSDLTKSREDINGKSYTANFVCWNTQPNGSGTDYYPGDWLTIKADEGEIIDGVRTMKLYAQYNSKRETKLFYDLNTTDANAEFVPKTAGIDLEIMDTNGRIVLNFLDDKVTTGSSGRPNTEVIVGKDNNKKEFTAIRPGWVLDGWAKNAGATTPDAKEGDKAYINTLNTSATQNVLYGVWKKDQLPIEVYKYEDDTPISDATLVEGSKGKYHQQTVDTAIKTVPAIEAAYISGGASYTVGDGFVYEKAFVDGKEVDGLKYVKKQNGLGYEWQYHEKDAAEDAFNPVGTATLEIYYHKNTKGTLTISKTVRNTIEGMPVDANQAFEFTLTDVEGATATDEFVIERSSTDTTTPASKIKKGETFKLKNGEVAKIILPKDKEIIITETPVNGYTASFECEDDAEAITAETNGYKTKLIGDNGTLAVTNTLATGNLTVTKTVSGGFADKSKPFTFTLVSVAGANSDTEFAITRGDSDDGAEIIKKGETFTLKNNESAVITLPQYRDVTITEVPDGYDATFTAGTGTTPATGQGATVENGLKFQVTAATASLGVTNNLGSGELTVSKEVTGQYGDKTKPFVFTLVDVEGSADTVEFTFKKGETTSTIKQGQTFTLADGEEAKITLPRGKVIEITEDQVEGYTTTFECGTGTEAVTGTVTNGKKLKLTADEGELAVENEYTNSVVPSGIAKSNTILIPLFLALMLALGIVLSIIQRRRLASRTR